MERLDERAIEHSGVKDRGFMDSIYFKDPLGLLIELASYRFEPPAGHTHAEVLLAAHRIRVQRGDYNIAPIHLADAIEQLVRSSQDSLSADRAPKDPYRRERRLRAERAYSERSTRLRGGSPRRKRRTFSAASRAADASDPRVIAELCGEPSRLGSSKKGRRVANEPCLRGSCHQTSMPAEKDGVLAQVLVQRVFVDDRRSRRVDEDRVVASSAPARGGRSARAWSASAAA